MEIGDQDGTVVGPDLLGGCGPASGPPSAAAAARAAVGPYAIVRRTRLLPPPPGFPEVAMVVAAGPRRSPFGSRWSALTGTGVALQADDALVRAVAEVLERYCLLAPARLCGAGGGGVAWAYSLSTGAPRALPVGDVHPAAGAATAAGAALTSTGVACHPRLEVAALSALLEVVERDALMAHWLCARPPRRIRPGATTVLGRILQERFAGARFEYVFLDVTTDTQVPTVACVALGRDPSMPSAVMGCAARATAEEAAIKAVLEATQVARALHQRGCTAQTPVGAEPARTLEDRAFLYGGAGGADRLASFCGSSEEVTFDDLPRAGDLPTVVERVEAAGMAPLIADLTTSDVAGLGYRAVRVVVPEMIDIVGDPARSPRARARLAAVARRMGWPPPPEALHPSPCPLA